MKGKIDVLYIHGGDTFHSNQDYLKYLRNKRVSLGKRIRWSDDYFQNGLGSRFRITRPRMPLQDNARYRDWKIMFENYLPLLERKYILIGGSLGGIFLTKYLSENKLPKRALSVYLICPPFDNTLPHERLTGGFKLKANLSLIERNCKNLHLLFSRDDEIVPVVHAEKYREKLPMAEIVIYKSKNGHFQIEKFPEIIKMIKDDVR